MRKLGEPLGAGEGDQDTGLEACSFLKSFFSKYLPIISSVPDRMLGQMCYHHHGGRGERAEGATIATGG